MIKYTHIIALCFGMALLLDGEVLARNALCKVADEDKGIAAFEIRPVPWITERAIELLEDFFDSHDNPRVLEFGAGASTIWMAKRTENLSSVEGDGKWFQLVKQELIENEECNSVDLIYSKKYYPPCAQFENESFDLILVDGRHRKACIIGAISKLKPGGVLMLDNSDRYYYHAVYPLMEGWETDAHIQTRPDSCGFYSKGWETRWWIKPKE